MPRDEAMPGAIGGCNTAATQALPPASLHCATFPARGAGEVCNLLRDCLVLWNVAGHVRPTDDAITILTSKGTCTLQAAPADLRPVRWFLQTPPRAATNRPPRPLPSIVAALSALGNALGGDSGSTLRIGTGGTST